MKLRTFLLLAIIAFSASFAHGDVVFDTFRSDGGFNSTTGSFVKRFQPVGTRFSLPAGDDVRLDSIDLPLRAVDVPPTAVVTATLSIRQDSAGEPGAILESILLTGITRNPGSFAAETRHANSILRPVLAAEEPYWLVIDYTDPTPGRLFWSRNLVNYRNSYAEFQNTTGDWFVATNQIGLTLRINATPVPEPSSLALTLVAGGLLLAGLARRRIPIFSCPSSALTSRSLSLVESRSQVASLP